MEYNENRITRNLANEARIYNDLIEFSKENHISYIETNKFSTLKNLAEFNLTNNKNIFFNGIPFDFYFKNGIKNISNQPTFVEIKSFINYDNLNSILSLIEHASTIANNASDSIFLILTSHSISPHLKTLIESYVTDFSKIIVLDYRKFNNKINKRNKQLENNQLEILHYELSKEDKIKNTDQTNLLLKLKEKYKNEELTLFIGAGTSKEKGVPLWKELTEQLIQEATIEIANNKLSETAKQDINLFSDFQKIISELFNINSTTSFISLTRYLKSVFSNEDFNNILHNIIYKKINNSKTLYDSLISLCQPRRNHIGVQAVITYNFDDLLEQELNKNHIETKIITSENDSTNADKLSIFHVHGYLPQHIEKNDLKEVELIFSEEDYHKIYRDSYHWSNLIQLNYLRESTGLFIGCSLTDPNLRRLLDVASRNNEEPRHFAILKRLTYSDNVSEEAKNKFDKINISIQEAYYKQLSINIIWVNDYSEIPQILNSLVCD